MPRGVVDIEGIASPEVQKLKSVQPPKDLPFEITKLGHMVLMVKDLKRSIDFYTQVLGMRVSDIYPETMMKGGMAFMRFNNDHHGIGLVGGMAEDAKNKELHHLAFEVDTVAEVLHARDHLKKHNVKIDFEGRRRAGAQIAVEFRDPDNHVLEIFWGLDKVGREEHARPPEEWREEFSIEDAINNPPPGQDEMLAREGHKPRKPS
jgi:catechol 2,3-dioxygenase-like lactoylglutathione lyase family enzyme